MSLLLFMSLSRHWRSISVMWSKHEDRFLRAPYKSPKRSITVRIRLVVGIIAAAGFSE